MKKGGIIAAIIIIVISASIFSVIGSITDKLPQPKFGDIHGFIFNTNASNKNQTVIIARFNITNSNKNDTFINISYENSYCEVFYFDESIGNLSLDILNDDTEKDMDQILYSSNEVDFEDKKSFFKNIKWPKGKIISTIKGGESQNYTIHFNISNDALSRVVYNHTMENNEQGKIKFKLNFPIKLELPFNLTIPIDKDITINIEKDIVTDILGIFDGMKYNFNLTEKPFRNIPRISMFKENESNTIQFNKTTRLLRREISLIDLYLGDESYWIRDALLTQINNPLDIRIGQEMTIYSKPLRIFLINKCLLPAEIRIYANDIQIGNCTIQSVERGFYRKNSQIIEATTLIDMSKFGDWIISHIENDETTWINMSIHIEKLDRFFDKHPFIKNQLFPDYGEVKNVTKNNTKLSEIIPEIELPKTSLDYSKINNTISLYQNLILIVIINTIIVVIILYFSFWKEGKYLIFK